MSRVAVVGAGIVGASAAYHLAREGVAVTLVDQAAAPAAGATGMSFAWIGGTGGDWPGGAEDLRASVLGDYRRVADEVPGVSVRWIGSLAWDPGAPAPADAPLSPLEPGRFWIGRREIAALEPHLRALPERAIHTPTDGGVDASQVTAALVEAACALGARVALDGGMVSLKRERGGGRVVGVESRAGVVPADTVVVAAGTGAGALLKPLGVRLPVDGSPAFRARLEAPPGLVRTILATPELEVRESREGELLVTVPYRGEGAGPALGRLAHEAVQRVRASFGESVPLRLVDYGLGNRPMPPGGPAVGFVTPDRSVYVAVMHSAVTLAPTVDRLIASELVSGVPAEELRRCRPRVLNGATGRRGSAWVG